jgi:hypothetical protein
MRKITIPGGRFSTDVKLSPERVLCNDVILPFETNPAKVRLWVISTAHGPTGAVWASNEEDALGILVDADLGAAILVDPEQVERMTEVEQEAFTYLGNNDQPADLTDVSCEAVHFRLEHDCEILCKFAEARGKGSDTLDDL